MEIDPSGQQSPSMVSAVIQKAQFHSPPLAWLNCWICTRVYITQREGLFPGPACQHKALRRVHQQAKQDRLRGSSTQLCKAEHSFWEQQVGKGSQLWGWMKCMKVP